MAAAHAVGIVRRMADDITLASGGRGALASVLATRGTRATPEAPFVIEHREALIYMLCLAAELEHAIMCQYLYAAFSLKQTVEEGLTPAQLDAVERWRRVVTRVATQEMLHLALVQNLLLSIGAAPHLSRPNLPPPPGRYPPTVALVLLPFGERALRHFMFLERPEGMQLDDPAVREALARAVPAVELGQIVPQLQDFATIGHLYRSIEDGFRHLAERYGEARLFCGPPRAQATAATFGWPELVAVNDARSAQTAIETIVEQGEGPRGHWRHAHFGRFVAILDEYLALRTDDPAFAPARPVLPANVRAHERGPTLPLITDATAARCTDLFNVGYEVLLLVLQRYFAHTGETDAQLGVLADVALGLMFEVLEPLGQLITRLPVGAEHPHRTAGPSFELFYESDYVLPHQTAAWLVLEERLRDAAAFCARIAGAADHLAEALDPVAASLDKFATALASGSGSATP
jgi:Ferritin-like